jgi:hypothetical protein
LKIFCSLENNEVHEEQFIIEEFDSHLGIKQLPNAQGQLDRSTELYQFQKECNPDKQTEKLSSVNQPANNAYFNKKTDPKERKIYIWFSDHPIICQLKFIGDEDNPCPSMKDQEVENVEHICYYNPGAGEVPTKEEMEATLKQVEEADKPDDSEIYVLDIGKPVCIFFNIFNKIVSFEIQSNDERMILVVQLKFLLENFYFLKF